MSYCEELENLVMNKHAETWEPLSIKHPTPGTSEISLNRVPRMKDNFCHEGEETECFNQVIS